MLANTLLTLLFFCSAHVTAYVQTDAARQVKCSSAGYFGYPDDCTRFYRCVDYFGTGTRFTAFHFICPLGTVFDESISVCNHPDWVKAPSRCAGQFQQSGNLLAAGPIVVPAGSGLVSPASPVPPKPNPEPQTTPEAVKPQPGTVAISTSSSTAASVDLSSPASVSVPESSGSSVDQTTPASASVESLSPASASVPESSGSSVDQTTPASASVESLSPASASVPESSGSSVGQTTPGSSSVGSSTAAPVDSSSVSSVDAATPSESVNVSSASSVDATTPSESVGESGAPAPGVTALPASVDSFTASSVDVTTPSESVDVSGVDETTLFVLVDTSSESSPDVTTPSESVESVDSSGASPIDETVPSETTDASSSSVIDSSTETSPEESTDSSIDESTDSSAAVPSESSTVPPVSVSTTEPDVAEETTSFSANPEDSTQSTTASPQESSAAPEATSSSVAPVSSPVTSFPTFFLACGGKDYYRHPLSCSRFYQCLWDGATINVVMFACGEGLVFDEPTKQCTTPDKTSPCKEMTSTTAAPVSVTQATTELSKPVNPTNNYTVTEDSLYQCPRPGHFAYELDCIRFYRCFEVTAGVLKGVLYRCPVGYSYSPQTERCQKQGDLAVCDKTLLNIFSRIPVPQIPLEQTPVVREEDLDRFFSDLKLFYSPTA